MRKFIALLLAVAMLFCLASCGEEDLSGLSATKEGNDAVAIAENLSVELEPGCVVKSYDMTVTLDTDNNTVSGYEDVTITNTSGADLDRVEFRYFAKSITKKSEITAIRDTETDAALEMKTGADSSCVYALMGDNVFADKATKTLRIEFSTVIPKKDDRFGYHEEDNHKIILLTFWAPQLAMLENGAWNESPYVEGGESTYNIMSDYTVHLTAPEDYVIAASGTQKTTGTETVITAPNVREMAIMACNYVTVDTEEIDGITVNMYRPNIEKYNTMCDVMLANAKEAISLYNEKIGRYIYDELDVIPISFTDGSVGGMEMPGLIMEDLVKTPDEDDDYDYYYAAITVAHEVAHQWFYCAIGNNQYTEPWLDESFAEYYSCYFYRETRNDALKMADEADKEASDEFFTSHMVAEESYDIVAVSEKDYNDEDNDYIGHYINLPCNCYDVFRYGTYVYGVGGYFLNELQEAMGDNFDKMMKEWYETNQSKIVHSSDFIKIVLKYDSSDKVKEILNTFLSDENIH